MTKQIVRTDDHPMANGREGQPGEIIYCFLFPLEDGTQLEVQTGQQGWDAFKELLRHIETDNWIQSIMEYEG